MTMVCISEIDMSDSVTPNDIDTVLTNTPWVICPTYHTDTVPKASPGAAVVGQDMLFDTVTADWKNRRLQAMPD